MTGHYSKEIPIAKGHIDLSNIRYYPDFYI